MVQSREKKELLQRRNVWKKVICCILVVLCLFCIKEDTVCTEEDSMVQCISDTITLQSKEEGIKEKECIYYRGDVEGSIQVEGKNISEKQFVIGVIPQDEIAKKSLQSDEERGISEIYEIEEKKCRKIDENHYKIIWGWKTQGRWKMVAMCKGASETLEDTSGKEVKVYSEEFVIDTIEPQLHVQWEGIRSVRPVSASLEHVNDNPNNPIDIESARWKWSPENEIYADNELRVSIEISEDYFSVEQVQIYIEKLQYDSGKRTNVTGKFYEGEKNWRKKEQKYIYCFCLAEEGHYRFRVSCKDRAGNGMKVGEMEQELYADAEYTSPLCTIDQTKPEIFAAYLQEKPVCSDGKNSYYREKPHMVVQIIEENFCSSDFQLRDLITWADESVKESLTVKDYNLKWTSGYEKGKRINTVVVPINREGKHNLKGRVEDAVHLCSEEYSIFFTYDTEKPEISCELNSDHNEEIIQRRYLTDTYFGRDAIEVRIVVRDRISGISEVRMSLTDEDTGEEYEDAVKILKKTCLNEGEQEWVVSLKRETFHGKLSVTAQDKGGLKIKCDSETIVLETEEAHEEHGGLFLHIPEADRKDEKRKIKYYRSFPSVKLKAQDSFSGLYKVSLRIPQKQKMEKYYYHKGKKWTNTDVLKMDILQDSYVNSSFDNLIYLEAELEDNAGNISHIDSGEYGIVIDETAPKIAVNYNTYQAENGSYYNCTRMALVTVRDKNFDPYSVQWDIQGSNEDYIIGAWQEKGDVWQCEIEFRQDGEGYKIKLSAADYAGNRTEWDEDRAFTIDKTAPKIEIKMDRKGCRYGKYYQTEKKLRFVLQEEHYSKKDTQVLITRCRGKKEKLVMETGAFQLYRKGQMGREKERQQGTIRIMDEILQEDGEYRIRFTCRDLAGNQAEVAEISEIVIDRTSPVVKIRGVGQGMVYSRKVAPSVQCSDDYLDKKSVKIELKKLNGKILSEEQYPSKKKMTAVWVRKYWKAFQEKPEMDGIYMLKVEAADYAGNRVSLGNGMRFYVNRYGAKYLLDDDLEKIVKKGYMVNSQDIVIEEWSVTDTETKLILMKDNQNRRILQEGENLGEEAEYTVEAIQEKGGEKKGWTKKRYQVSGKNFEEEGLYRLTLESTGYVDSGETRKFAGETNNELKGETIRFTVDKTAPVVKLGSLDQRIYKEKKHIYTVTAMDNCKLKKLQVTVHYLDGGKKDETILVGEEELDEKHSIQRELNAYHGFQKISYEAWDEAGNRISSDENGDSRICLVTDQRVLETSRRKARILLPIGFVLVIIFCALILTAGRIFDIVSKRRNR